MSSLSQAISIALTGLQTNTALINVASNNISNASTPGYTDKTASVASVDYGPQFGGSSIASYSRSTDQALTNNFNQSTSNASYSSTQNQYLSQIQTLLGSTSANPTLSADVANFSSAWSQYSSNPESALQQDNVITAGKTLVNDIQNTTTQIGTLVTQVQSNVSDDVNSLNADLNQIASLNQAVQSAVTSKQPAGDLQDKLDVLVNKVSSLMTVTVQSRPNGQIALYTPAGQLLVDSSTAKQFSYNGNIITDSNGTDVTSAFSGGSIQAATDFINTSATAAASTTPGVGTIAKLQSQLSELVNAFTASALGTTSAFATAYSNAVTNSTAVGAPQAGTSVAAQFFTVTNGANGQPDPGTFAISSGLIAGTSNLPQTGAQAIADSFNSTASYNASGLNVSGVTYATLTSAILSTFQQAANTVNTQSATTKSQQTYYQQTLANTTGVNIDTELANLVAYQNSYAASAHVISTVSQMMAALLSVLQ
jgi:flagellar hook-associated protein 1